MYFNNIWMLCFNTDQNTTAFKEVAIIRHPRVGEYAFGFITSTVLLQVLTYLYNCIDESSSRTLVVVICKLDVCTANILFVPFF
jgi:hypothetical protein